MDLEHDPDWASAFIQSRQAVTAREQNELHRRTARGELVRIIPGVYLPKKASTARTAAQRHRDLVAARALVASDPPLFSHASAAALWRLPRVGRWPGVVHVVGNAATGGRSTHGVVRHGVGYPDVETRIDGIRATTLDRTVIDLARTESHENAVIAADAGTRWPSIWFDNRLGNLPVTPRRAGGDRRARGGGGAFGGRLRGWRCRVSR